MKAVCWHGKKDVRLERVPDPRILNPRDAIVRITSTAICGSDLHLYDGVIPTMEEGDILGHEFMGEVIEAGPEVRELKPGDRVVVPFTIACGACFPCKEGQWSACDNSNPNAWMAERLYGHSGSGLFGYSHMMGGYAGGQAEYARVPFADTGALKIPEGLEDEQVLFLSDILPTAWQAAEQCSIRDGDTVAVFGCGPVGLLSIACAYAQGAVRVIAIDTVAARLKLAEEKAWAIPIDATTAPVLEALAELTGGRGPDACIDAVGMEAHGLSLDAIYDRVKTALALATDRGNALRLAILACRKGGTVSIPGVYGGLMDEFPVGVVFAKGLTLRAGQTRVHAHMRPLLEKIEREEIDPTFIITHRLSLDDAEKGYREFAAHDGCVKVVLQA